MILPLSFPPQYLPYIGAALILIGLVMAFAGKAMFRSLTGIIGAVLGGQLGFLAGGAMGGAVMGFLLGAVGAIIGGILMRFLVKIGMAALLGILGFLALWFTTGSALLGLVAFLVIFIVTIWFMDKIIIFLMAAGGGLALGFGTWLLTDSLTTAALAGLVVFVLGTVVQFADDKRRRRLALIRSQPVVRTVVQRVPVYVQAPPPPPPRMPPPPPPPPGR